MTSPPEHGPLEKKPKVAPFPAIGAFTYFTQRLVLTKRSMELSKTHLEWLGLLSFTLLPWLTAMLTQHLCMALATPSGRGGRKPLGCLLRCFLTTRSGNSTQLQVYYGSSESKSLPGTSVFFERTSIGGFLRVPLFMMFPQVNSAPERRYFLTVHTLWWVRWNVVCFRKPCLLHQTELQMFKESHSSSRDINYPFGGSHSAALSPKCWDFFFFFFFLTRFASLTCKTIMPTFFNLTFR